MGDNWKGRYFGVGWDGQNGWWVVRRLRDNYPCVHAAPGDEAWAFTAGQLFDAAADGWQEVDGVRIPPPPRDTAAA